MMTSSAKPTVSVVIPVHNGGESFHECLSALIKSDSAPHEIIVVADGDTDGSRNVAGQFDAQVLITSTPGGPARARNLGARTAQGDVLFFVDADVLLPPGVIRQIAAIFRAQPELAAVFGSYDDAPAATNFLSQYKNLLHHYVHQTACEEAFTFWSACGAIRRDVFLALGGFDERYRQPSIEDIELGYRLREASYQTRLCKALQVKHLKRWDAVSLLKSDFFQRALPWSELILWDRRFVNDLNLRLSSRISVMLTYGLLGALVAAWKWPGSLALAGVLILLLLAINLPLYRFFQGRRGVWFALQAIPWHWFFFYSGLAFAIGVTRYVLRTWGFLGTRLSAPLKQWSMDVQKNVPGS